MTEDRPLYGNPICACSFRSQGHEPGECEDFAVVGVWMWEPEGGWHYVSLCGPCIGRCGQLSTEEYVEVSEGRELPRENGWSVNDPAPRLERLGSDQAGSMRSNDEPKSGNLPAPRLLPEKLTPSEIEALRQDAKDGIAHARMAFAKKP